MEWLFREVANQTDVRIIFEKDRLDDEIRQLMTYMEDYDKTSRDSLAVKIDGEVVLIRKGDILALDVDGDYIKVIGIDFMYSVRTRLYQVKEKLPDRTFVQVSRQSVINIDHLKKMEASFSGNMMAVLTNGFKVSVSRRYVKVLEKALGL